MKNYTKKGFTLVELLVVVTILSILATIAYIYFESSLAESRDAKREGDMLQIVNSLELYETENSEFPEPHNATNITFSGAAIAWKQGTLGASTIRELRVFGSDVPVDPLYKNEYTYSVTAKNTEYQVASVKETLEQEEGLGELAFSSFNEVGAATIETAYVLGDYNGFMVKARDGGVEYFIATPSIISTDISDSDVISTIVNRKLVYNEFFNLPHSYRNYMDVDGGFNFNVSDPVVFSGSTSDLKSEQELLNFDEKLKYVYATTPTESFDKYVSILEKDGLTSLKGFLTRKFKIQFKTYFNCKDILDDGLDDGDRMYMIDPDGPEGEPAYEVYCDMTTDGGGWTRVGDNHVTNGNFSAGAGITGAIEHTDDTHEIVALSSPVDENEFALHQTGNYSSNYQVTFDDSSLLKSGYEVRMTLWRSDYGSGAVLSGTNDTIIMGGKSTPWTVGTCTSGTYCFFKNFNSKMANPANFGAGGNLTDIDITVKAPSNNITTEYLNGGVLFDGYIPSVNYNSKWGVSPYTTSEKQAINNWVKAGGFLVSTNDEDTWDPLGEYYSMQTYEYGDGVNDQWLVQNIDHPIVNGSIGLGIDLRGQILTSSYAHSAFVGDLLPEDIVLARDVRSPFAPTVILRKQGRGTVLITSGDGVFKDMSPGNTFDPTDNETVFAAAIMAYAIEEAAGINPHEGYAFHNRIFYNDGTFSTNGEDQILETITVDDNGTPRVWTKEQTRHKIYKTPENFNWYIGLDANNNKDLYFTGIRLELFYR